MKVGVIIPDRGDRPQLLAHCLEMIGRQTLQPEIVELVNDKPLDKRPDITRRYRLGYDRLREKKLDVIAFMENDDWYDRHYLDYMVSQWLAHDKPDLFGTNHTIYFNITIWRWFEMLHDQRSAAMNTLIKPDMDFKWCPDNESFTDLYLYNTLPYKVFRPERLYSIGIKHGIGKCGGKNHFDMLYRFKNADNGFLKRTVDKESFSFYEGFRH